MNFKKIGAIALIGALAISPALAVDETITVVDAGTTPDSPMYKLDLFMENMDLAFTFSDDARIEKLEAIDEERLAEMQFILSSALEDAEKEEFVLTAKEERDKNFANLEKMYKVTNKIQTRLTYKNRKIMNFNGLSNQLQNMALDINGEIKEKESQLNKDFEETEKMVKIRDIYDNIKQDELDYENFMIDNAISEEELIVVEEIMERRMEDGISTDKFKDALEYIRERSVEQVQSGKINGFTSTITGAVSNFFGRDEVVNTGVENIEIPELDTVIVTEDA